MRVIPFLITAAITTTLIIILNSTWLLPAPLGKLLSPQHGIWQNADPVDKNYNEDLSFPALKGKVEVYIDDRLVPHVFAEKEEDVYFVQGYLHAKFRLWQMELQTFAAAGRVSEIIGDKGLEHDREFRRLGMGYAAEKALQEMENDPVIKTACDAYTAGVNAYIESLPESQLPIEYKLIGYQPEKWTNLKSALFIKYMAYDLAGHDDDFEMTNAKNYFSPADFNKLFPVIPDSLDPVIPKGTMFVKPKTELHVPATADSLYYNNKDLVVVKETKPDRENGSNNWAVSGAKTQSGAPILCNDPHLGLNLPSLWYEIQLSAPGLNVYGASFPGGPGVIIGFNDSCSFGVTNGGRDVRDYYEIKFKDDSRTAYWFDNGWVQTDFRKEVIKIKGRPDYIDTVAYTVFGPVMYDKSFSGGRTSNHKYYAVRWKAHDPSNELKTFNLLNHAKNYNDYKAAIAFFHTPGQNFAFACKNGDIAMQTQGEFPAKWYTQGDFIMPGIDSSYMWQGMIPSDETPFQYNPERGFVSSANQRPVDSTYPYYLGRDYPPYRGIIINRKLNAMSNITVQDMMAMQTDNYDVFAEMARPVLLKNIKASELNEAEKKYAELLSAWDLRNDIASKGATVFNIAWDIFYKEIYDDEYAKAPNVIMHPLQSTLLEALLKDSAYSFVDNISTPETETLPDEVTAAFKKAAAELKAIEKEGRLEWGKYKDTRVNHLAKLPFFSRLHIPVGGGRFCINATKEEKGASWRMIVQLSRETEAWGVYPGGQSGNPGSPYYDNYIDTWAQGKYNRLWMMEQGETEDKRVKWKITFNK
ncbi:MAG TPA: penicillin acylase family protein [Chitinophagaceae bacterium]|nr:penicillin acylase family protein [Chitinophagaceae bacterium]